MKKILSILVMVLFGVSSVWAETYTTGKHNYNGTPQQYLDAFNNANGKYVTMTASSSAEMKTPEGYIRPGGSGFGVKTGHITLTAATATYVNSFTAILGGSNHSGKPVTLRWNEAPIGDASLGSASWRTYDVITEGADKTVQKTSYNEQILAVYTGGIKQWIGGNENNAHLQDVSTTIWVPEVVSKTDGQTAREDYPVTAKPSGKGASIEFPLEYNVKHAVNAEDFTAEISNFQGKGSLIVSKKELVSGADAENKKLKVTCTYTAANEEDFATNYSADLVISSKNTVNTNTFTTHITGSAGTIKANNELKWIISGPYYVNTTIDNPTFTNSDATIKYISTNTSVADFEDGKLVLNSAGTTTLSASQEATDDVKASNCEDLTILVEKRTPAFTLNPGNEVYTSLTYNNYISPASDPNGTMNPAYTSLDELLFTVDADGNLITNAGLGTATLQAVVEPSEEWNGGTYDFPVNVVRDPIHVPLCLTEERWNNPRFFIEKTGAGAAFFENRALKMGGSHSSNAVTTSVVFHITGSPEYLNIGSITKDNRINSITIEQSSNNEDWLPVGDPLTDVITNLSRELSATTKYIKITYVGVQLIAITDLCITERVGASITPNPIELVVLDDGTGGKLVMDASFTASVSNLTALTLQLNSDDFILLRDGKTYNETDNTLLLDYTDGLGIDKNASAIVQVHYVGDLTTALDKTCTITALDENDVVQSTATIKVIELPAGDIPAVIIPGIADRTGIFTGTEMFIDGHATYSKYPYRKKEEVNLSAAFKGGVAAFDQLFVFGLTTNEDDLTVTVNGVTAPQINKPSATANSNAVTPCFIYTKNGNNYALSSIIPNVNIATKPTEFNITDMSKSYYFTGYAPYASCGSTWEENAVFLFTSKGNAVNLYLDNLELYARPKAATGNKVPVKQYTVNGIGEAIGLFGDPDMNVTTEPELALEVFVQGSGAAFAFASTSSTEFKPTIHLRGTNILESTAGASVRVTSSLLSMDATASQQSSPIQVLLKKDGGKNSKTNLTITDTWADGTTRTNGILDLANLDVRPAPTIDLGNANTTLNINGGQYFLSNAANTSISYTVSYAISYRKKSMAGDKAQMFGLGDDQPEGKVRFKDGSINCSVLPKAYFNESLYHNQTSMKCPQDTKIDGGTFNCDVLSCASTTSKGGSPTNTAEQALCIVEIPIASVNSDNGTAVLANDWMTYALEHGAKTNQLGYYGIKSMQPTTIINDDEEEVPGVRLMLPSDKICFMEMVRIPWVLCTPDVTVKQTGVTQTLGGNKTVESSIAAGDEGITNVKLTARLLYAELDDYTRAAIDNYTAPGGYTVSVAEVPRRHVQNTDSYLISDKIYWVRPVVANQWQMIVPPFDVANIYIVESYPEEQLLKDFGEQKNNIIGQEVYVIDEVEQIRAARLAQAQSMMDLVYYWMYDADPAGLKNDNDLWPKKGWDMSKFMREWVDYEVSKHDGNKAYQPIIEQLYHFTGSNWDANYYLYESSGEWVVEGDKFVTDWQLVPTQSVKRGTRTPQTIMHKGGIYAMSFPYSIYNDGSHKPDEVWDYWTGKYIIMEGYPTETNDTVGDVQVLSGTNTDWDGYPLTSTVLADFTTAGRASLRGNSTFGEVTVQKQNALILPAGGNTFIRWDNHTLAPGEGFMLANAPATPSPMPRRIASIDMMTGDVTYEPGDGSENTVTGTPTIAGEREMLVYTAAGGLGVVPVVPQHVSIYNAAGQLVVSQYLTDNTQFALPTGIYLVCGEKDQAKAMVK